KPGVPPDYSRWENDNQIVAVAVGEEPLMEFVERGQPSQRKTPSLTGTKFRFISLMASPTLLPPGTNDDRDPPPLPLMYKEIVVYASRTITLDWNVELRSYVARDNFQGVLRAALVAEAPQTAIG